MLIFLLFFQNSSNPLLFTHCCCYSKELTYLTFCIKLQFKHVNSLKQQQQCVKSSRLDKFCKKQKKNEYCKSKFPAQKSDGFGLQVELKFAFKITLTHCFHMQVKVAVLNAVSQNYIFLKYNQFPMLVYALKTIQIKFL